MKCKVHTSEGAFANEVTLHPVALFEAIASEERAQSGVLLFTILGNHHR
jgi:hypothetical protein